jgi:hypothetical protein
VAISTRSRCTYKSGIPEPPLPRSSGDLKAFRLNARSRGRGSTLTGWSSISGTAASPWATGRRRGLTPRACPQEGSRHSGNSSSPMCSKPPRRGEGGRASRSRATNLHAPHPPLSTRCNVTRSFASRVRALMPRSTSSRLNSSSRRLMNPTRCNARAGRCGARSLHKAAWWSYSTPTVHAQLSVRNLENAHSDPRRASNSPERVWITTTNGKPRPSRARSRCVQDRVRSARLPGGVRVRERPAAPDHRR